MPAPESFPIDRVHVPDKKRKTLKPEVVDALAESILESGQREPILVRREKDHYVLVEGLHRLEACKALGEPAIKGRLISAEEARQRELPPPPIDPEREKMERLRKLRLEREEAEKLAASSRGGSAAHTATRARGPADTANRSGRAGAAKPARSGAAAAAPKTLSDWIKQQERSGGRY
ncbi:transcriptional regulator [Bradyrhizobium sp. SSBR45G]|uniref:ParB N-terminal domain-containing protein n=1 Tax=unclassified Bradyrhizobium TaxID=2631580 RepID=UPI00234292CB|nr:MULTISPECIES: ParB N-terminal domain-containing protein [unclassified Bradyrhizobium]GLH80309.1 transcriptional regulator [Bradyrhizobium sp. SSBR45G]GLH87803.1 transcriptional regulator [Bradyrhizobium sp. SSBR45R]